MARWRVTYGKPKLIDGVRSVYSEVVEREEIEVKDSFIVFSDLDDTIGETNHLILSWEPGMRVEMVTEATSEELREKYPSLDPEEGRAWNEGLMEHCSALSLFLLAQPDFVKGEYIIGGPSDILAGFQCSQHDHHKFRRTVFQNQVGGVFQGVVKKTPKGKTS